MSKDITEGILLKEGFTKQGDGLFKYKNDKVIIFIEVNTFPLTRHWRCHANNGNINSDTDIQTIGQFNKLMELMDIEFRFNYL